MPDILPPAAVLPRFTARALLAPLAAILLAVPLTLLATAVHAQGTLARTSLGVDVGYTSFSDSTAAWTLGAVSLAQRGALGTAIARVTTARRFGGTGTQYELDAYPRFSASTYGYLNAGYSAASIFPEWRFGGELFTTLPRAYEASLGLRHLRFVDQPVTLYTGSVGKYAGNYWLSLRPYVRTWNGTVSASAGLTARRYFATADEYIGARVGYGTTPTDRLVVTELARTSDLSAAVQGSRGIASRLLGTWTLGVERERLDAGHSRNRVELDAGARVDF